MNICEPCSPGEVNAKNGTDHDDDSEVGTINGRRKIRQRKKKEKCESEVEETANQHVRERVNKNNLVKIYNDLLFY